MQYDPEGAQCAGFHSSYFPKAKRFDFFFLYFSLDSVNYHNSARDNQFPAHHTARFPAGPAP